MRIGPLIRSWPGGWTRIVAVLGLAAEGMAAGATVPAICANATGRHRGHFYTVWHDGGDGCLRLRTGGYRVDWRLEPTGNLVAGEGWAIGSPDRIVRYRATVFAPGRNGYLALYGWSRMPLAEYYVVENWGDFVPPGPDGVLLGTVATDGGTYRIFRTQRVDQPSIAGRATFVQYWSVRTRKRPIGTAGVITFRHHVDAWRKAGLVLGSLSYQVLATEGYGSSGHSEVNMPSTHAGTRQLAAPRRLVANHSLPAERSRLSSSVSAPPCRAACTNPAAG